MTPEEVKKELDDLKLIVNNHRHLQYDQTKTLGDINSTRYIIFKVLSPVASHSVTTTLGGDLELPFEGKITDIGAFADTAGTTGTGTIDVNLNGTTMMSSTKITLDSTEKTSRTAATPPVLTTTTVNIGDIITVDIDAIQTTPAKGLSVILTFQI